MTVNVSEFFRDAEQFALLESRILPGLLQHSPRFNVWSAGCGNGAEPYSLALLLEELSPGQGHGILATDISDESLEQARVGGPYTLDDVRYVPVTLLLKHFTSSDITYRINDSIRLKVEFRRHDLLRDPFEVGFDLIICRYVLMYFSQEANSEIRKGFSRSLKDGGILFIGAHENLPAAGSQGLERITASFFRKVPTSR